MNTYPHAPSRAAPRAPCSTPAGTPGLVSVKVLVWCHCCHCSLNFGYKGSHFSSQTVSFCYKAIRI